jgi:hypothetical protein
MDPSHAEKPSNSARGLLHYQYEALDHTLSQIRISGVSLMGNLHIEDFSSTPRENCHYEALSYVWGGHWGTFALSIGGPRLSISETL